MKNALAAVIGMAMLTTGCASIVSDSSYPVTINSNPEGATFLVTNDKGVQIHSGRTPSTVTLKSGSGYFSSASYTVTLKKEGFEDKSFVIESKLDGWYVGNILFGGLIGFLIVDPITGAMWKLPDNQNISMDQKVAMLDDNENSRSLEIVDILQVPEKYRDHLVRIN